MSKARRELKGKMLRQPKWEPRYPYGPGATLTKGARKMDTTEMLARMWIECDPNRGGAEPDEPLHLDDPRATMHGRPTWEWFVPRAEATLAYLAKRGYRIVPVEPTATMLDAGLKQMDYDDRGPARLAAENNRDIAGTVFKAMVGAATGG